MAQPDQRVDVLPAANATPAAGEGFAGPQDVQCTRLVIDLGDGKTIELTLRGKLTLESIGPPASAGDGDGDGDGGGSGSGTATAALLVRPSEQAVEDRQFMDEMRGWLMTVATLFIGISFQAAMQPPSWITPDWYDAWHRSHGHGGPSPSPASAAATMTRAQGANAFGYMVFNTITFSTSLALVIFLVMMEKSPPRYAVSAVTSTVWGLCFFVGWAFLLGNSYGPHATAMVTTFVVIFFFVTYFFMLSKTPLVRDHTSLWSRWCRGSRAN